METIHFVDLTSQVESIQEQLAIEEALFRADDRNWCLVNRGSIPSIVMGISGKPEELLYTDQVGEKKVPLIRRYSGGGTVVVDEDTLFVSFIGNHALLPSRPFPKLIMEWSANLYAPLFEGKGFRLRCQDYALGERKIGGNAQSISKGRFVHHTTFLWDYKEELMGLLKIPKKQPTYRQDRSHGQFLTTIQDFLASPDSFFEGLRSSLRTHYLLVEDEGSDFQYLLAGDHRKATREVALV